jgi:hypothetical protein
VAGSPATWVSYSGWNPAMKGLIMV